jgi:hypothetical protein
MVERGDTGGEVIVEYTGYEEAAKVYRTGLNALPYESIVPLI